MKLIQWLINLFFGLKKSDKKIREIFFNLVETNKGSITALDLAMSANLSGTDAKKFLEQFAVEFDASFEVTEQGHMVYLFPIRNQPNKKRDSGKSQTHSSIPPEKTRTIDRNQATIENKQKPSQATSSNHQTQNINTNTSEQSQTVKQPTNSSRSNEQVPHTDIEKKIEDIENDFKNIGQSLNKLFKF